MLNRKKVGLVFASTIAVALRAGGTAEATEDKWVEGQRLLREQSTGGLVMLMPQRLVFSTQFLMLSRWEVRAGTTGLAS